MWSRQFVSRSARDSLLFPVPVLGAGVGSLRRVCAFGIVSRSPLELLDLSDPGPDADALQFESRSALSGSPFLFFPHAYLALGTYGAFRGNDDVDDVCDEDPVLCLFPSLDPTSLLAGDIDIAELGVACGELRKFSRKDVLHFHLLKIPPKGRWSVAFAKFAGV